MQQYILSKREKEIMTILWDSESPLTSSEICKKNKLLSINTVQSVMHKMLKKDFIEIAEIVYSGTVLTRRYKPKISPDDYATIQLQEHYSSCGKKKSVSNIVSFLLDEEENETNTITEIENMLNNRKKQIKDNGGNI